MFFQEFPENSQKSYFNRKPSDKSISINLPYFIKEHLRIRASDEAKLKKNFGGVKPSTNFTLKTKWYLIYGCCDDSRSCEQLKKRVTYKYFEKKFDFEH